jgi:GINS complex subunit 2
MDRTGLGERSRRAHGRSGGSRSFASTEVDFFAQDELITIVPNFSIHSNPSKSFECISGTYGPFAPSREVRVPLWLALALWKRKKCDIKAPEWMSVEYLQTVLELERGEPGAFQPLPFHYIEIAQFLFTAGMQESLPKQVFEDEEGKVRDLINLIQKTRQGKILQGLSLMQEAAAVKLNNLSAMELNSVRAFFTGTLDEFTRHANMKESVAVRSGGQVVGDARADGAAGNDESGPAPGPARNLRRR